MVIIVVVVVMCVCCTIERMKMFFAEKHFSTVIKFNFIFMSNVCVCGVMSASAFFLLAIQRRWHVVDAADPDELAFERLCRGLQW